MNLILIDPHELSKNKTVCLSDGRSVHIRRVLKADPGKRLRVGLLNGPKGAATVEAVEGNAVILRCEFAEQMPVRPAVDLLLAMPRPKVMKRLWAQLAALGVGRIMLVNAQKVERFYFDSHVLEPDFYTERLTEGLQQAGDTLLPEVRIVKELKPFLKDELDALFSKDGIRLLADPSGCGNIFRTLGTGHSKRIILAIGPEGGWTPHELDLFMAHGFAIFNAGRRILRTDTACVALLSMLTLLSGADEK